MITTLRMNTKKEILFAIILSIFLIFIIYNANPEVKVKNFVLNNQKKLEESYTNNVEIPNDLDVVQVNYLEGQHNMLELILFSENGNCYGCYYSPDDVPLTFQNKEICLNEGSNNYWTWKEVTGDNKGITYKIKDNWYYFETNL